MKAKIFVTGNKGCYHANFTIGVQTFKVCDVETKREALWYCKMIRIAFKNLKSK